MVQYGKYEFRRIVVPFKASLKLIYFLYYYNIMAELLNVQLAHTRILVGKTNSGMPKWVIFKELQLII